MRYRCQTCRADVPSDQPRLTHVVRRADGTIYRELVVCGRCKRVLTGGKTVSYPPIDEPKPTGDDVHASTDDDAGREAGGA